MRAASQSYNDLHARWSVVLPDTYRHSYDQYDQGDEQHPGFHEITVYDSSISRVSVGYAECCRPDATKRMQIAQANFDEEQKGYPNITMGPDGIQPTTLSNKPALQYDTFDDQRVPLHGRTIIAFSGFLSYDFHFLASADRFDALQSEFAAITDSFRFTVRSVVAGVYTDPQGRFTFTTPLGYDMVPNFDDEISDQDESGVTLAPNPIADGNRDPHMVVQTFAESRTFDAVFDVYATKGLQSLAKKGAELGPRGLQRTTLDGRAAGIEDFYAQSDTGVRFHTYQIFTVIGDLQYAILFAFPDDTYGTPSNPLNTILASFHFQVSV